MASAANKSGPGDAIVTPLTVVGVLVRAFSTELEDVPPRASRSALMALTAVSKVMASPVLSARPVSLLAICRHKSSQIQQLQLEYRSASSKTVTSKYLIQLISDDSCMSCFNSLNASCYRSKGLRLQVQVHQMLAKTRFGLQKQAQTTPH